MRRLKPLPMAGIAVLAVWLLFSACSSDSSSGHDQPPEPTENTLLIWQIGAATDGEISHSFVELYNNSEDEINLGSYSLQYAAGYTTSLGATPPSGSNPTKDGPWQKIDLTGTIAPHTSFLILGSKGEGQTAETNPALDLSGADKDMTVPSFTLSNRALKVALMSNKTLLDVQNPYKINENWAKAPGYVDMVGAINTNNTDFINGCEKYYIKDLNKQTGQRRLSLTDSDNNEQDFGRSTYTGMSPDKERIRPKSQTYGAWNPVTGQKEGPVVEPGTQDALAGELLILQTYVPSSSPAGASHPFVELYNNKATSTDLNGITLYYADGYSNYWRAISLSGKTIPAKASFLIMGHIAGNTSATRLILNDADADIYDPEFTMSNNGYKVALIRNSDTLNVYNPFTMDGAGAKADGYIDMVGVYNNAATEVTGFETAPARGSAAEAVRRKDLDDHNNNSTDFTRLRYNLTPPNPDDGYTPVEPWNLDFFKPKNSSYNGGSGWDPFNEPTHTFVEPGTADTLAGELLILQTYIPSSSPAGASHPFVELYNTTDGPINLNEISLYFADGNSKYWGKVPLDGKTIPAEASFLIMGPKAANTSGTRLILADGYGDINDPGFTMSNNGYKIALIRNTDILNCSNPFDMGSGVKADGYIDMVGVYNNDPAEVTGCETAAARGSASEAARRANGTDTNNNSADFIRLRYNMSPPNPDEGYTPVKPWNLDFFKPKTSSFNGGGGWDPFGVPPPEPTVSEKLMILQAGTAGNDNGGGGGYPKSIVELYNNTGDTIDFDTNNYYMHTGNATGWTHTIKLAGQVPAYCSFLIVTTSTEADQVNLNSISRALLPVADQTGNFVLVNNDFCVAIVKNQASITGNPFTAGLGADYVDMLGCRNAIGYEGTAAGAPSRPQPNRRKSLVDTDNNNYDFGQIDLRGIWQGNERTPNDQLYKIWPRNTTLGSWDPISGETPVHPTVVNP